MKRIPLTQGLYALVDDADFEWLNQWKWFALKGTGNNTFYAVHWDCSSKPKVLVRMHTVLLERKLGRSLLDEVDHEDNNGLNNQKCNLREATASENSCHRGLRSDNTSGFKGVSWINREQKWYAQISIKGKYYSLGYFDDPREAARAYDRAAVDLHGEFAKTNKMLGLL